MLVRVGWSWISHGLAGGGGHLGSVLWWSVVLALSAATTFAASKQSG